MDSGYYAAMTGLEARSQALDTAAANLANAQTPGYRAERDYFRSVLLGPGSADSQLGQTVNDYGLLGGDRLSQAQGALEQTGNPLDLAIEGQGFFAVQSPHGVRYTRDGSFHRSQKGLLVTSGWTSLCFLRPTNRLPCLLERCRSDPTESLSVAGAPWPRWGFSDFAAGVQLTPEGANRYTAPAGAKPVVETDAVIHQGAIEGANQDVIQGTMELIVMQRQAEMMQKALTIFHTDFNKFASEDLARV